MGVCVKVGSSFDIMCENVLLCDRESVRVSVFLQMCVCAGVFD